MAAFAMVEGSTTIDIDKLGISPNPLFSREG
jgi:hypothetical protein